MKDPLNTRPQGAPPGDGLIARSYRLCLTLLLLCFIFIGFSGTQAFAQCPTVTVNAQTAYVAGMPFTSPVPTDSSLYTLNLQNGVLTRIGSIGAGLTVTDITVSADGKTIFGLTSLGTVISFSPSNPSVILSTVTVTGIGSETLVGFDRRPSNGLIYAIGRNGATGSVYTLDPTTGVASRVAPISGVTGGSLLGTFYGVDFNPVTGGLRVVNDADQNLRLNPDTGANATATANPPGPDANINPTSDVAGVAYTNNFVGATATTLYDIDFTSNNLLVQNPPNSGTVTIQAPLTLGGTAFDITGTTGFDIYNVPTTATVAFPYIGTLSASGGVGPYTFTETGKLPNGLTFSSNGTISGTPNKLGTFTINVTAKDANGCSSTPTALTITIVCPTLTISGNAAFAAIRVSGATGSSLYSIDLATSLVRLVGQIGPNSGGNVSDISVDPVSGNIFAIVGNNLASFNRNTPGTYILAPTAVTGLTAGSTLVAIDFRPLTGQLYGLSRKGNAAGNMQLYTINTTTAAATLVGPAFSMFTDNNTVFGFDFNPTVDRIRIVSDNAGQNLRANPNTGAITDDGFLTYAPGDINDDGSVDSFPAITAVAYTNNFAGATTTTLYDLDSGLFNFFQSDSLAIQNPPNNGLINTQIPGFLFIIDPVDGGFIFSSNARVAGFDIDSVTNGALQSGNLRSFYSQPVITNGAGPNTVFTYSLATGSSLPPGLTLSPTGIISGEPTSTGSFTFTVKTTEGNGCTTTKSFTLFINPAICPQITFNPSNPGGSVVIPASPSRNTNFNITVNNNVFSNPTFFLLNSTLPSNVTVTPTGDGKVNVSSVTGVKAGTYTFVLRVTDFAGCTATQSFQLVSSGR